MNAGQASASGLKHTLFPYQPFWHYPKPRRDGLDFAAAAVAVRESLLAAIHQRLNVCDVPFGVLLSGGLDSSIVAAVASRYVREHSERIAWTSGGQIHTFSVGMDGSPDVAVSAPEVVPL